MGLGGGTADEPTGGGGGPAPFTKMYVASNKNDKVFRANLDGTGGEDLGNLGGISGPTGIALDLASGKMYVVSNSNNKVFRANLDGTGDEDLGNLGGISGPVGIALSP